MKKPTNRLDRNRTRVCEAAVSASVRVAQRTRSIPMAMPRTLQARLCSSRLTQRPLSMASAATRRRARRTRCARLHQGARKGSSPTVGVTCRLPTRPSLITTRAEGEPQRRGRGRSTQAAGALYTSKSTKWRRVEVGISVCSSVRSSRLRHRIVVGQVASLG